MNHNLNPVWDDQTHQFLVHSADQQIVIDMFDEDLGKSDNELGTVSLCAGSTGALPVLLSF